MTPANVAIMLPADAAAVATINAAWIALAAGLAGVILTVIAGFIGAMIEGQREHKKWIRDARLRAYADHIAATDNYLRAALRGDDSELAAIGSDSMRSMAVVHLVGPDDVAKLARAYQSAAKTSVSALDGNPDVLDRLEDDRLAKREAFVSAARKQVRI
jgi:hypothetical protein